MAVVEPARGPRRRRSLAELPPELRATLLPARELARRRAGAVEAPVLVTGIAALDRVLEGGLPRGTLTEVTGRGSCGRLALVLAALAAVTSAGEVAVLVDLGDGLDPRVAEEAGVDLRRLLWVRPRRLPEAVAAAGETLAAGLPLVVVEAGLPPLPGRAPAAAWIRLGRLAAAHRAVVLVAAPHPLAGAAVGVTVRLGRGRARWTGLELEPRLLEALEVTAAVRRRRGGHLEAAVRLMWRPAAAVDPARLPTAAWGSPEALGHAAG